MILVDTNVLLDIYKADPIWMPWSLKHLHHAQPGQLVINIVVYAELAGHPAEPAHLGEFLVTMGVQLLELSRPAARWRASLFAATASAVAPKPACYPTSLLAPMRRPRATNCSRATLGATTRICQRSS
jgi:predicted nucleic acid-binding protein